MTAYPLGFEVSCDGPDENTDCHESAAIPIRFGSMTAQEVRADGREVGWIRRRRAGRLADLCPDCAAVPTS